MFIIKTLNVCLGACILIYKKTSKCAYSYIYIYIHMHVYGFVCVCVCDVVVYTSVVRLRVDALV